MDLLVLLSLKHEQVLAQHDKSCSTIQHSLDQLQLDKSINLCIEHLQHLTLHDQIPAG
jgi:hypothetical protein